VRASTNDVEISANHQTKFAYNQLNDPEKQGPGAFSKPGSFGIADVPMQLHAAVKMLTTDGSWSTIYVDRNSHVGKTNVTIQPQNEVSTGSSNHLLFFVMFNHLRSTSSYGRMKFQPRLSGILLKQTARRLCSAMVKPTRRYVSDTPSQMHLMLESGLVGTDSHWLFTV
jgi:hypothetical protein